MPGSPIDDATGKRRPDAVKRVELLDCCCRDAHRAGTRGTHGRRRTTGAAGRIRTDVGNLPSGRQRDLLPVGQAGCELKRVGVAVSSCAAGRLHCLVYARPGVEAIYARVPDLPCDMNDDVGLRRGNGTLAGQRDGRTG